MATSQRQRARERELLAYLHSLVNGNGQPELLVNPSELAGQLGCTREAVGQMLSKLVGAGYRKIRIPGAHVGDVFRQNMRVIAVKDLPPLPPPAPPPPKDAQWEARARSQLAQQPGLLKVCQSCFAALPMFLQPLGYCGDCLQAQEDHAPLRRIPAPDYSGGRFEAVRQAQDAYEQRRYWGRIPGPGYGRDRSGGVTD